MIDPLDYLTLAKDLLNSDQNEIKIRTAIGRSYYAVYLCASQKYVTYKKNDEDIKSKVQYHKPFIKLLLSESNANFKKLGNQLNDLCSDREKADYKITEYISKSSGEKSYSAALRIVETIEQVFAN